MPVKVELARLKQAIDQFCERPPQQLPDGLLDRVQQLGQAISDVRPSGGDSPGAREAREAAGGGDATKAPEKPKGSPGQRAATTAQEFAAAAGKLAERVGGTPEE